MLALVLLAVIFSLAALRAHGVNHALGDAIGCSSCLGLVALSHDSILLSSFAGLGIIALYLRRPALYVPVRLLLLAGLTMYLLDVIVFDQFFTRLNIGDVRTYASKIGPVWNHLMATQAVGPEHLVAAVAGAITLLLLLIWPGPGLRTAPLLLALLLPLGGYATQRVLTAPEYVHDWAIRNVVDINLNAGVTTAYSPAKIESTLSAAQTQTCGVGLGRRDNIVLLVLESWSPYQSALYSGLRDWTPRLDRIALEGRHFTRFHAAGFSTNEGLMSLITGMELLSPTKSFFAITPFESSWNVERSVPRLLKQRGYHTAFLTTGNLDFSAKAKWLIDTGFQYIEGHTHPAYDGLQRLHFSAAEDAALYRRSLAYLDELDQSQPWLLVVETVSTHHPYIHPHTLERSEEAVFGYMDESASHFVAQLRQHPSFDNGWLVITSDHRAMIPIPAEEHKALGRRAPSLIPAIVLGPETGSGEIISQPYHQADLLESIDWLTGNSVCTPHPRRDMFFPQRTEARCVFHARGSNRDLVDVFCPEGEGTLQLAGDRTRMLSADSLDPRRSAQLVDTLNAYRIRAGHSQD